MNLKVLILLENHIYRVTNTTPSTGPVFTGSIIAFIFLFFFLFLLLIGENAVRCYKIGGNSRIFVSYIQNVPSWFKAH